MLTYSAIACVDETLGLGHKNDLLFKSKIDLQNFKRITEGEIVVMGRKTADSIIEMNNGKFLPNRTKIILTRNKDYEPDIQESDRSSVFIYHDIESMMYALNLVSAFYINHNKEKEVFILGGEQIYSLFSPYLQKLYLTQVSHNYQNKDTWFPINLNNYDLQNSERHEDNSIVFAINTYIRKEV